MVFEVIERRAEDRRAVDFEQRLSRRILLLDEAQVERSDPCRLAELTPGDLQLQDRVVEQLQDVVLRLRLPEGTS